MLKIHRSRSRWQRSGLGKVRKNKLRFEVCCKVGEKLNKGEPVAPYLHNAEDLYAVRAIAGHSINHVEGWRSGRRLTLEDAYELEYMVHGTYIQTYACIIPRGLMAGGVPDETDSTGRNGVMCSAFPFLDPRCESGMRKGHGRKGPADCQVYLDPEKVLLCRETCMTSTGVILVRGSIPPSYIVDITDIIYDKEPWEATLWDSQLMFCVPWYTRKYFDGDAAEYF